MPKKFSEDQKNIIVNSFIDGVTINELAKKFCCTNITITRHLKKIINEKEFKDLLKRNKSQSQNDIKKNSKNEIDLNQDYREVQQVVINGDSKEEFVEIIPMNFQIDNESQKDLSSIPIYEIDFPKTVYMIVDNKIELETKLLKNYPEWQFLSQKELSTKTIQIFLE